MFSSAYLRILCYSATFCHCPLSDTCLCKKKKWWLALMAFHLVNKEQLKNCNKSVLSKWVKLLVSRVTSAALWYRKKPLTCKLKTKVLSWNVTLTSCLWDLKRDAWALELLPLPWVLIWKDWNGWLKWMSVIALILLCVYSI